jgi:hypothetical protein
MSIISVCAIILTVAGVYFLITKDVLLGIVCLIIGLLVLGGPAIHLNR